ncbi:MAG TPA: hypothetical protein VE954_08945 [Oligoflexus sp.]|uniref:hypothetical protein n=1 Tax=Oligoflexus sp. TaxID=1971216 RepID=UPI002D248BA5|nr:hypothetical protein [Oligoflexus sp.]HYX33229.1 hypothetical protein [Oligoflexus sp.]
MDSRAMTVSKNIFSALCFLIATACGQESKQSSYLDAARGIPGVGEICNKEDVTLYIALRNENGPEYSVNGWRIIAPQECKSITDWVNQAPNRTFYIQSEKGLYIPKGEQYYTERYDIICLPYDVSLASVLSYTYTGKPVYETGFCPSGFSRYQVTNLGSPLVEIEDDDAQVSFSYTMIGGSFDGSQKISIQPVVKGKSYDDVLKELADIKRQHEKVEKDLENCEREVQRVIALNDVFKVKISDLDGLKDDCGYNYKEIEDLKESIRTFRREAFDGIKGIAIKMRGLYESLLAKSQTFGISEPIKSFMDQLGIGNLIRPAVDADKGSPSFFEGILNKYKEAFAKYYQQETKSFFVSVLGYLSTFASFGEEYVKTENIDEKSYIDYLKTVEAGEKYFGTVDFDKADFGYEWDSPVSPEVRELVHKQLIPMDTAEGTAIEEELKKWSGTLTAKRKEMLEALGELIRARIAMKKKASQEAALAVLKLRAITSGLREGLREAPEFGKCVAVSTAFNDFGDFYAVVNKRDICTGEELTTTGQVISAAGIVLGTSKVWREVAEEVGFAVRTQRVLKDAADLAEAAKKFLPDAGTVGGRSANESTFLRRVIALSDDTVESGKYRLKEGVGGARYEVKTGNLLKNGDTQGVDFVDTKTNQKISLKGPYRQDSMDPIPPQAYNLENFAKSALKPNSAVDKVVVDLYGLNDTERKFVKEYIAEQNPAKIIEYLE